MRFRFFETRLVECFAVAFDFIEIFGVEAVAGAEVGAAHAGKRAPRSGNAKSRDNRRQFTTAIILSFKVRPE